MTDGKLEPFPGPVRRLQLVPSPLAASLGPGTAQGQFRTLLHTQSPGALVAPAGGCGLTGSQLGRSRNWDIKTNPPNLVQSLNPHVPCPGPKPLQDAGSVPSASTECPLPTPGWAQPGSSFPQDKEKPEQLLCCRARNKCSRSNPGPCSRLPLSLSCCETWGKSVPSSSLLSTCSDTDRPWGTFGGSSGGER